jgi:ATP-binding cassette subfamily B protein
MLIKLLLRYLRPYRRPLALVVGLQLVGTMASLYLPSLNADIIDNGVAAGDTGYIMRTGFVMLGVSVLQMACSIGGVYYGARTAMAFGRDLRAAIFHGVGSFSSREFAGFGAPSLITRITNDVQQVQMLVVMACTMFVAAPIMCVGGIVMAMREDLRLSWLMVVSVPVLFIAIGLIVRRLIPTFGGLQTKVDGINRVLRDQTAGIRVVRAFVREPGETQRFAVANAELTDTSLRAGRLMTLLFPVVMVVLNVSSVAVLWFGAGPANDGSLQVGALTAFLSYLMQILMSVMMATFMLMMAPRAEVCAKRIDEVLGTQTSVAPPAEPIVDLPLHGQLELRGVQFHYPGAAAPVLRDVSFTARAGQTTAIVGSTGAGKTTLISLIPRLFDVTAGAVLVDGADVRDIDPDALWRRIGIVPQRPYLFSGTIASNLRYGNPEADDELLWRCLRIAQAQEFVAELPDQLAAPVNQGGTNFSGGQRQRLAIARALVREPEIYLFDDSFSALDLGTDARLRAALRPVVADAAVIVVAQRVSTVMDADQIVVLEDGAVVGIGRHDELIASCPTYAEIVDSQLSLVNS